MYQGFLKIRFYFEHVHKPKALIQTEKHRLSNQTDRDVNPDAVHWWEMFSELMCPTLGLLTSAVG